MGSIGTEPISEPIAIIGLSCKFAGDARTPEELWKMLEEGRNAWSEIPESRFNPKGFYHSDPDKLDTVCVSIKLGKESNIANLYCDASSYTSEAAIFCRKILHISMPRFSTSPRSSPR